MPISGVSQSYIARLEKGEINPAYDKVRKWMINVSKMLKMPDMIIYLDVPLQVALKRIKNNRKNLNFRGKSLSILEESKGLKNISEYYEYFFENISVFMEMPIKIERINAGRTSEYVLEKAESLIRSVTGT